MDKLENGLLPALSEKTWPIDNARGQSADVDVVEFLDISPVTLDVDAPKATVRGKSG